MINHSDLDTKYKEISSSTFWSLIGHIKRLKSKTRNKVQETEKELDAFKFTYDKFGREKYFMETSLNTAYEYFKLNSENTEDFHPPLDSNGNVL